MEVSFGLPELLHVFIALVCIALFVAVNAMVLVYVERKVAGFVQRRPGPYEVGPHGLLQMVVDVGKLLGKQVVKPAAADPFLFWLAPIAAFCPILLLFLPLPFSPLFTGLRAELGLLLILSFSGLGVIAILLAGWASNSKYSLFGAARGVAQAVAYEIPLLLAVLALVLQYGTLNLSTLVEAQGSWPWQWNFLTQPLAFAIFVISMFGETNRAPFDLPEAESELGGGFHTEYSGMGFGMFFLAEYASMIVVCAMCTTLFLGGWKGPLFDGIWWFLGKTYFLLFFMMWVRWTFPRVRFDQLLNLNWKWLIPLGVLNLIATAFMVRLLS